MRKFTLALLTVLGLTMIGAGTASAAIGDGRVDPNGVNTVLINEPNIKLAAIDVNGTGASIDWLTNEQGRSGGGIAVWNPDIVAVVGINDRLQVFADARHLP